MTYIKNYTIKSSPSFSKEFEKIYKYLLSNLKEENIANKFYNDIKKQINSLQYFPERNIRIFAKDKENLRRMIIHKFLIVYEVKKKERRSLYLTYFSF